MLSTPATQARILGRRLVSAAQTRNITKVGVIGMGLMGHGIALNAAQAGYEVVGLESSPDGLANGMGLVDKSLSKVSGSMVKKGKMSEDEAAEMVATTRGRMSGSTDKGAVADCDLIIEAIVEDYDVKNPLWAELGELCKDSTIFASNTSSLSITKQALASGRAEQFCGLHYFNPVQLMRLVEIVRTEHTSDATIGAASDFVKKIGKTGVHCGDTPGFIVNRLLVPYMVQAMLMAERGDATPEDIDTAMRLGAGHPMGPIHLTDYVGQDTNLFINEGWVKNFPDEPAFVVPQVLRDLVKDGKLGRKSGQGFYEWDSPGDTMPKHLKRK